MAYFYLTQNQGTIIGPIAYVLGLIMNAIFNLFSSIGIENIALCIILFTFIINLLMLPLTIRQQRFSKLQQKMSPELNAIRKKYEGRKDNASLMAQQEETKELYAKYGVSQMGSCLPLLIQLPILWALYRVIYAVPAYVSKVKDVFIPLAKDLLNIPESFDFMQTLSGARSFTSQFTNADFSMDAANDYAVNTYIDVLNRSSTADWQLLENEYPSLSSLVEQVHTKVMSMNNFLGLNIGDSPSFVARDAISTGRYYMILFAILVPLFAAGFQWVNTKLMPQAASSNDPNDPAAQMQSQMRMMNMFMPLMSAFIVFSLPIGVGLYWIAGSVIRIVLQVIINRSIDRMNIDEMIARNEEKYREKQEKKGEKTKNMSAIASMNTRNLAANARISGISHYTQEEKDAALNKARECYESGKARKGSLLEYANMVRAYEEKNNRD